MPSGQVQMQCRTRIYVDYLWGNAESLDGRGKEDRSGRPLAGFFRS